MPAAEKNNDSVLFKQELDFSTLLMDKSMEYMLAHAAQRTHISFLFQDLHRIDKQFAILMQRPRVQGFVIQLFGKVTAKLDERLQAHLEEQYKLVLVKRLYRERLARAHSHIDVHAQESFHKACQLDLTEYEQKEQRKKILEALAKINSANLGEVKQGFQLLAKVLGKEPLILDDIDDLKSLFKKDELAELLKSAHQTLTNNVQLTQAAIEGFGFPREIKVELRTFDYKNPEKLCEINLHLLKTDCINKLEFFNLSAGLQDKMQAIIAEINSKRDDKDFDGAKKLIEELFPYAYYLEAIAFDECNAKIAQVISGPKLDLDILKIRETETIDFTPEFLKKETIERIRIIITSQLTLDEKKQDFIKIFQALNDLTNNFFGDVSGIQNCKNVDELNKFLEKKGLLKNIGWINNSYEVNTENLEKIFNSNGVSLKYDDKEKLLLRENKIYCFDDDETIAKKLDRLQKIITAYSILGYIDDGSCAILFTHIEKIVAEHFDDVVSTTEKNINGIAQFKEEVIKYLAEVRSNNNTQEKLQAVLALQEEKIVRPLDMYTDIIKAYESEQQAVLALSDFEYAVHADELLKSIEAAQEWAVPALDVTIQHQLKQKQSQSLGFALDNFEQLCVEWNAYAKKIRFAEEISRAEKELIKPILLLNVYNAVQIALISEEPQKFKDAINELNQLLKYYVNNSFSGNPEAKTAYIQLVKFSTQANDPKKNGKIILKNIQKYLRDLIPEPLNLNLNKYPELNKSGMLNQQTLVKLGAWAAQAKKGDETGKFPLDTASIQAIQKLSVFTESQQSHHHANGLRALFNSVNESEKNAHSSEPAFEKWLKDAENIYQIAYILQLVTFEQLGDFCEKTRTAIESVKKVGEPEKEALLKKEVKSTKELLGPLWYTIEKNITLYEFKAEIDKHYLVKTKERAELIEFHLSSLRKAQHDLGIDDEQINIKAIIEKIKTKMANGKDCKDFVDDIKHTLKELSEAFKNNFDKEKNSLNSDGYQKLFDELSKETADTLDAQKEKCEELATVYPEAAIVDPSSKGNHLTFEDLLKKSSEQLAEYAEREKSQIDRLYGDIVKNLKEYKKRLMLQDKDLKILDDMIISIKQVEKLFPTDKERIYCLRKIFNVLNQLSCSDIKDFRKFANYFQNVLNVNSLDSLEEQLKHIESFVKNKEENYVEMEILQTVTGDAQLILKQKGKVEFTDAVYKALKNTLSIDLEERTVEYAVDEDNEMRNYFYSGQYNNNDVIVKITAESGLQLLMDEKMKPVEKIALMNEFAQEINRQLNNSNTKVLSQHIIPETQDPVRPKHLSFK